MVRRVTACSEVKQFNYGAEVSSSSNSTSSCMQQTRNREPIHVQDEEGKTSWRSEPTPAEMVGDEVWIAEKFQSNPDRKI